jgi:hypothetical protein
MSLLRFFPALSDSPDFQIRHSGLSPLTAATKSQTETTAAAELFEVFAVGAGAMGPLKGGRVV